MINAEEIVDSEIAIATDAICRPSMGGFANDDHFYFAGMPYLRITHTHYNIFLYAARKRTNLWIYDANLLIVPDTLSDRRDGMETDEKCNWMEWKRKGFVVGICYTKMTLAWKMEWYCIELFNAACLCVHKARVYTNTHTHTQCSRHICNEL